MLPGLPFRIVITEFYILYTNILALCYNTEELKSGMSDSFLREGIEKGSQWNLTRCPPL